MKVLMDGQKGPHEEKGIDKCGQERGRVIGY